MTDVGVLEKFDLDFPVQLADGRKLTAVHLRRPKVRELKQAQRQSADPAEQQFVLMSLMSQEKLTPEDFDDIDLSDFMKMNRFFRRIMGDDLAAAGNSGTAGPVVPVSAK
nr:phage tail assembly protein [Burkholderia cenocepacia]